MIVHVCPTVFPSPGTARGNQGVCKEELRDDGEARRRSQTLLEARTGEARQPSRHASLRRCPAMEGVPTRNAAD